MKIEIRTGSQSDIKRIGECYSLLDSLDIPYSARILSAHRTPHLMVKEAQGLVDNCFRVSIAAAGGSAHLPGMTASETLLPVIGIPVMTSQLNGVDSFCSIFQMPPGIPVGSVGIGKASNAALLACQISHLDDIDTRNKIRAHKKLEPLASLDLKEEVAIIKPDNVHESYNEMVEHLEKSGVTITQDSTQAVTIVVADLGSENNLSEIVSNTDYPVIVVPQVIDDEDDALDKINSIGDDAVALMGINRFSNASLFAQQILGNYFPKIREYVKKHRESIAQKSIENDALVQKEGITRFL